MPKERSGGPRLDWSSNWEKYGYDNGTGPCMKQISSGVLHAHAWQSRTESHCSYNRTCMASLQEVN